VKSINIVFAGKITRRSKNWKMRKKREKKICIRKSHGYFAKIIFLHWKHIFHLYTLSILNKLGGYDCDWRSWLFQTNWVYNKMLPRTFRCHTNSNLYLECFLWLHFHSKWICAEIFRSRCNLFYYFERICWTTFFCPGTNVRLRIVVISDTKYSLKFFCCR
jgi:hypothetical protein